MKQYLVTGMSCAACQASVEKAVSAVSGVTACSVSLLTNSLGVEGDVSDRAIIEAVEKAGYSAALKGGAGPAVLNSEEDPLVDRETPVLKRRLLWSLGFLLVLMIFSMGHKMLGIPIPSWFEENFVAQGLLQLLLAAIVMLINKKFFVSGFQSARHGAPNMDTLVALGSFASFIWSVYALFRMTDAQLHGGALAAKPWMEQFYFESAAMVLTLITVGKMLEAKSKGKTTNALKALMRLSPKTATVLRDGVETAVPAEEVQINDLFVVRPGENIPVDGVVLEGNTAVNEAALTGESLPVDKAAGDTVSTATTNLSGFIRCRATAVGENTALSQIIRMMSDAAATKAPIAKIADRVSGVFVPTVITIAAVTLVIWLLLGKAFDFALARAISVLVISCPCALGLATPVAIMVGNGVGARHGILFKTAVSLEETGKVKIVALDKTGTVTKGEPEVTGLFPAEGVSEEELLAVAYSLERKSEHPLARAIVKEAVSRRLSPAEVTDFRALPGNGLSALQEGEPLCGGSVRFVREQVNLSPALLQKADELSDLGATPLLFAKNDRLLGIIAVSDPIKPESPTAVSDLKKLGIRVVLLTGDNRRTAHAIGQKAGIDHVVAGVLPDEKEEVIHRLKKLGKVAMVGDGINDAPALTGADRGIAIGAGTDIAIDAADVVLMNSKLSDVPAAIRLSRKTLTNIRENLFWAFFYNALCIPLAAGCYIGLFGWELNPMVGAAAMSLSSFCVVSNALRLNFFDLTANKYDRPVKNALSDEVLSPLIAEMNAAKEKPSKTVTLVIEGMMCPHCEARVRKALEKLDGVEKTAASFSDGTAVVTLSEEVPFERMKAAVEEEGYPVLSIH